MADPNTEASTDLEFVAATVSTPLQRAAGRLRAVLPPGWRVEIVDAPERRYGRREPILRAVMPTD
ncbi:hypothetical protein [Nocardia sp. CNY236]|uniref:hypothetical protein n=1 Tax=Nocardia sp. CNY236 TaxID=1169152 RepID=UPI000414A460|nr:hypothetical protein [Nocardia sp. CNY236]